MKTQLAIEILPQPDDSTCGPTCLHAVYRYFGDAIPLERVVAEVEEVKGGGTLAVNLARNALLRGYEATIYTYNLRVFDPTWFRPGVDLEERLRRQAEAKPKKRLREATASYLDFLALGGRILYEELNSELLARLLASGPVITGLSATYLYSCARERGTTKLVEDDIRGQPQGHFVVLGGFDAVRRELLIADPLEDRPGFESHLYSVGVDRALGAMLLGVLTYDANLAVVRPGPRHGGR
jgi:hypothetical protein